ISRFYKAGAGLRLQMYQKGLLKSRQLPCFVISIGNIMAGGAGKTPMAIYLAQLLKKMGKKPVVISRGYKGTLGSEAKIVGDGKTVFLSADTAGDEPYMMAKRKIFPVVVGKDRYTAGTLAIKQLNPDVIILDDGFQHLKLKRDINILLFDHDRPLGNKKMLPAGRLRETPNMSKNSVHTIIFTRSPEKAEVGQKMDNTQTLELLEQYPDIPYFKALHTPSLFQLILSSKKSSELPRKVRDLKNLDILKGRNAVLFSGIANNRAFSADVRKLGCNILDHLEFKDHFIYKSSDIHMIQKKINSLKADMVVTTEKDWVKIGSDIEWNVDIAVIGININFQTPLEFENLLKSQINRHSKVL
ncbi:MAG: tetraacyldisaccharide 4'-kinase, partial [Thermodesulfobacteriota bacterium]